MKILSTRELIDRAERTMAEKLAKKKYTGADKPGGRAAARRLRRILKKNSER